MGLGPGERASRVEGGGVWLVDGWRDAIYNMPSPPAVQNEYVHLDGTDSQGVAILRQLRGSHGSLRLVWLTCLSDYRGRGCLLLSAVESSVC